MTTTPQNLQPPVDYIPRITAQYSGLGYGEYRWLESEEAPAWTPLSKPLSESKLGLICTGGIYASGQTAFHFKDDTVDNSDLEEERERLAKKKRQKVMNYIDDIEEKVGDVNKAVAAYLEEAYKDGTLDDNTKQLRKIKKKLEMQMASFMRTVNLGHHLMREGKFMIHIDHEHQVD